MPGVVGNHPQELVTWGGLYETLRSLGFDPEQGDPMPWIPTHPPRHHVKQQEPGYNVLDHIKHHIVAAIRAENFERAGGWVTLLAEVRKIDIPLSWWEVEEPDGVEDALS